MRFRSKFMERVIKQEAKSKEERESQQQKKVKRREKTMSYAKYVKEIHWPEASRRKNEELEEMKARLKHPVRHPGKGSPGRVMSEDEGMS